MRDVRDVAVMMVMWLAFAGVADAKRRPPAEVLRTRTAAARAGLPVAILDAVDWDEKMLVVIPGATDGKHRVAGRYAPTHAKSWTFEVTVPAMERPANPSWPSVLEVPRTRKKVFVNVVWVHEERFRCRMD